MELTEDLKQEILDLAERTRIEGLVYLAKRTTQKNISQEVRNYYKDTNDLALKIQKLLQ